MRHDEPPWTQWNFDAVSGALVSASVRLENSVCGGSKTLYRAGPDDPFCQEGVRTCELCLSGPKRDATCPADVVERLPNKYCVAPTPAPGCSCTGEPSGWVLPPDGAPCGEPVQCPSCQDGTCWADCVCMSDGVARWRIGCTE